MVPEAGIEPATNPESLRGCSPRLFWPKIFQHKNCKARIFLPFKRSFQTPHFFQSWQLKAGYEFKMFAQPFRSMRVTLPMLFQTPH